MNKIALEVVKLSTRLDELKKKRIEKYVAFGDDYEYKYDEDKTNESKTHSKFLDDKIAQIDFANIANNKQDQSLLGNFLHSAQYNNATNLFTEVSQFRADNIKNYRQRCLRGEVRMIPPFEHLRNEFASQMPQDLLQRDGNDDILAFFSDAEEEEDDEQIIENEKASDFAMNILNSCSPISTQQNMPKLPEQKNLSIFNLGNQVNPIMASSGSIMSESDRDRDETQNIEQAFLSRTDTKRDHQKEWVNFDDDQNLDDDFSNFFENNTEITQKKKISKRIKGGIGNVWNKAKEKRASKKNKNSPIPTKQQQKNTTTTNPESKDFDVLDFFGSNAQNKQSNGYSKQHNNNIQKTKQPKNTKKTAPSSSMFDGFDFNQDSKQNQTQNTPKHNATNNNAFGDLFGDFSSNKPENTHNLEQKKSVKALMQSAYKKQPQKNNNKKSKDLFDDLFD